MAGEELPDVEFDEPPAGWGWGAPGVGWGDPAQDPFGGQGLGGGAGGLVDAFGGDLGAAEGGLEVAGLDVRAGGVERGDRVPAAVLQPADDVAEGAAGDGGGEQGAGEDLFGGGGEERVACGPRTGW